MKNFNKIALFAGILLAFLFLVNQKADARNAVATEIPGQYSEDGLHALAFLQPESSHSIATHVKTGEISVARSIEHKFIFDTGSAAIKIAKSFFSQDINRCETVSLLLFPHHIFW